MMTRYLVMQIILEYNCLRNKNYYILQNRDLWQICHHNGSKDKLKMEMYYMLIGGQVKCFHSIPVTSILDNLSLKKGKKEVDLKAITVANLWVFSL
jgi:hypothetical protein